MPAGSKRITLEEGADSNPQVLDFVTAFFIIIEDLAVLASQAFWASIQPHMIILGDSNILIEFDDEVIDLLPVFVELVLAEEYRIILRPPALVLEAIREVWARWANDQLSVLSMPLNSELQREVLLLLGLAFRLYFC